MRSRFGIGTFLGKNSTECRFLEAQSRFFGPAGAKKFLAREARLENSFKLKKILEPTLSVGFSDAGVCFGSRLEKIVGHEL